jgi:[ribosomal protein S18]-alanine N-acetyltransferase
MPLTDTNCLVKKLTLSDLAACWALDQRCFPAIEVYDRDMLRYLLANPYSVSYKLMPPLPPALNGAGETNAANGLSLIGVALGQVDHSGVGHVVRLAVAPEYQHQGYGRQLLQAIEAGFQAAGISVVHLEVRATNKRALHLYVQSDYIIVERLPGYYQDGEDALMMVKALNFTATGSANAEILV